MENRVPLCGVNAKEFLGARGMSLRGTQRLTNVFGEPRACAYGEDRIVVCVEHKSCLCGGQRACAYGEERAVACAQQRAVCVGGREPVPMEVTGLLSVQDKSLSLWGAKSLCARVRGFA